MSLIILRECSIGITWGDSDLLLDTISEVTLTNNVERTLVSRKNLYNRKNTQAVLHRNNDSSSGTLTCYLTRDFQEKMLFRLLGCEVYEGGFVVPSMVPDTFQYTPAKFLIAYDTGAYEIQNVLITSVTMPLGKAYAGEIQVSFEAGALEQVPRGYRSAINSKQGTHIAPQPLEFIFNEVAYAAISANINISQNVTWLNNKSIFDNYNTRRPVITGHSVNITTTQYHRNESLASSFENIRIKQGNIQLDMEQASITRRLEFDSDIITISCDIQPSSSMPTIQII